MALYLSIVSKNSVTQSLVAIGLMGYSKRKKNKEINWDDIVKQEKIRTAHQNNENQF